MNASKKIRVMLVVPMLDQGGLERVCALTSQLLQNKYEVYVVVFNGIGRIYDVSGAELIDLGLGAVSNKWGKLLQVVKRAARLSKIVKEKKVQIVYSFGRTANIACSLIYTKVKKICACHSHEEIKNIKYLRLMDKRADIILCCSKAMAKEVGTCIGSDKVKAVWNPCDIQDIQQLAEVSLPAFQEFFKHHNKIIVAMGREDDVKGYWHLIKAFYLVQKEIPQMRLIIMGDGSFEQAKSLVSELQLEQKVYFPGVRKNPYKYLAASEMFLLSSYTEGFPNVLVEAMILGRPLISTDCRTGPAEILEHGKYGILVPDMGDTEDYSGDTISEKETYFAEKIIEVLKDSERQKELSELERKRAGEFDYDSYVDNLLKLCYNKSL